MASPTGFFKHKIYGDFLINSGIFILIAIALAMF